MVDNIETVFISSISNVYRTKGVGTIGLQIRILLFAIRMNTPQDNLL